MNICLVLMTILIVFIEESIEYLAISELQSNHSKVGDYPNYNMNTCGYLNPKHFSDDQAATRRPTPRIIEGEKANLGEFPWHAMIIHKLMPAIQNRLCNGALIHKLWVLTSRACLLPRPGDAAILPGALSVWLGTVDLSKPYKTVDVSQIILNPKMEINLALVRLASPVLPEEITTDSLYRINYICLPRKDSINVYGQEKAIISGFGNKDILKTDPFNPRIRNDELRKTYVTIDSDYECSLSRFKFGPYHICGAEINHPICWGDHGGGLVQFDYNQAILIGIISTNFVWDESYSYCEPGVHEYVRVSYSIGFILDAIDNKTIPPFLPPQRPPPPPPQGQPPPPNPVPTVNDRPPGPPQPPADPDDNLQKSDDKLGNSSEDNLSVCFHKFIAFNVLIVWINICFDLILSKF